MATRQNTEYFCLYCDVENAEVDVKCPKCKILKSCGKECLDKSFECISCRDGVDVLCVSVNDEKYRIKVPLVDVETKYVHFMGDFAGDERFVRLSFNQNPQLFEGLTGVKSISTDQCKNDTYHMCFLKIVAENTQRVLVSVSKQESIHESFTEFMKNLKNHIDALNEKFKAENP